MADHSFEQFLQTFPSLLEEVREIKDLLIQRPLQEEPDQLLTIDQAGIFLNLSVATLYTKVQKAEIPNCKRGGRLYFSKHDLVEWVKAGRRKTTSEIQIEAEGYLRNKKRSM